MQSRYDVAVVGAGPGGSTAAAFLSRAGLKTLLLDKAKFPRDKSCGDAVCSKSVRILKDLGLDAEVRSKVFAQSDGQVFVSLQGDALRLPFAHLAPDPRGSGATVREPTPAYVIKREIFDDVLFQHASRLPHVTALEEFTTTGLLREGDSVRGVVGTDREGREQRFSARLVIGADGAMSKVAEAVGAYDFQHKQRDHWIAAFRIYYQGVRDLKEMEIHFLDGLMPGYFWIFPVGGGLANVGAGMIESQLNGASGKKVNLRKATCEAIANHPRFRERFAGAREVAGSFRGGQLPCGSERRKLAGDGWMLIGDAASLIDPFSGEGISNAMHSAQLAAETAAEVVQGKGGTERYAARVWEELGPELDTAYQLQKLTRFKWLMNFLLRKAARSERIREAVTGIAVDQTQAKQLLNPLFYLRLLVA